MREKRRPFVNLFRGLFVLLIRVCEAAAESEQYVHIVEIPLLILGHTHIPFISFPAAQ